MGSASELASVHAGYRSRRSALGSESVLPSRRRDVGSRVHGPASELAHGVGVVASESASESESEHAGYHRDIIGISFAEPRRDVGSRGIGPPRSTRDIIGISSGYHLPSPAETWGVVA